MKYSSILLILFGMSSARAENLDDYIQLALQENPTIQSKMAEVEASRQKVIATGFLPDPKISVGYFLSPVETRVGPQQAKIGISQMFPAFGSLKIKEELQQSLSEGKTQELQQIKNQIIFELKSLWFQLLSIQEKIMIQKLLQS